MEEVIEEQKPDKQATNRNKEGRFIPGVSGNPNGRPKGITLKETARKRFENPKEREKFIDRMVIEQPGLTWQMLEGRPTQPIEHSGEIEVIEMTAKEKEIINKLAEERYNAMDT